jgi:16S rRNA C1402 (ribose-2'-O) methylase RsmI
VTYNNEKRHRLPQLPEHLLIGFSFVTRVSALAIRITALEELKKNYENCQEGRLTSQDQSLTNTQTRYLVVLIFNGKHPNKIYITYPAGLIGYIFLHVIEFLAN